MGNITFIENSGEQHTVDISEGKSLMQIAMDNDIPGIDADCGGQCACGTCHVIIEDKWFGHTGEVFAIESQMLEMTPEQANTSRLSCQIPVTEDMHGMVVYFPEFQM